MTSPGPVRALLLSGALAAAAACTTAEPPAAPGLAAEVSCSGDRAVVGKRALRRLTNAELEATIRAAFALDSAQWPGLNLPPESGSPDGFNNQMDRLAVDAVYLRSAEQDSRAVAALVSADPIIGRLLPCAATADVVCAETFITTFGTRLYRRPLSAEEKARYLALFQKAGGPAGLRSFVHWATATMLQSPHVLYRTELGRPDGRGRFRLDPHETASALAYTFTGGPPDAALMELAASDRLSSADQVESAARTLVFEGPNVRPAFREVLLQFSQQWLALDGLSNLQKDPQAFPEFSDPIKAALAQETRAFLTAVVIDQRGTVADLLTAPFTVIDGQLARYYGFGDPAAAVATRASRPAGWGTGLLAQGSLLATRAHSLNTSPTRRGLLVRTRLLCGAVPPPPAMVGPLPEPTAADTTRQRYETLHAANAACRACHQLLDPIGFGFEHLDASGRYRAREGTLEIDDSGTVASTSAGDRAFRGPTELAATLSSLPEVSDCLAAHLAAYAFGVGAQSGGCLAREAAGHLQAGGSLVDFAVRLARSDHFRFRQP